ncbi:MAG: HAD-IC family P-type ATPase, partial [Phycisphaerales bacterium]|nr:HAD-IC family P-type ATPase [Phycisphaerales bacterium]
VWYLTSNVDTAIVVLVVVCPSALLISSPTAMMAAFAAAARLGIMIKQTNELESAANIDTIVLDKTGTLTTGRFEVSRLAPVEGVSGAELLQAATNAEQHSNHPLARSILATAEKARVTPNPEGSHEELHGRGVRATIGSDIILAGRPTWLAEENPACKDEIAEIESQIEGITAVHVMKGKQYLGAVGLEDKLRYNAKGVVEKLRDLGASNIVMMTGDRFAVAKRVGVSVGVDQVEAECLPEEKHDLVQDMVAKGRHVLMVGDGINDGPSLAAADVGIAMGLSGSDIATNSAGIALMNDDLSRIPFLVMLARRSRTIVAQNISASIIIAIIGLIIAATGNIHIGLAAFYHFLGDVLVIGNSFRLIRFGEEFAASSRFNPAAPSSPTRQGPRQASASISHAPSSV